MKYGPGKYEGCGNYALTARYLYEECCDDEIGSVDELGWFGRFDGKLKGAQVRAIVCEDNQGFVDVEYFDTTEALDRKWSDIENAYGYQDEDEQEA